MIHKLPDKLPQYPQWITTNTLYNIQRECIKNSIIMPNDKNPGELTEECPVNYFLRIKNELYDLSSTTHENAKIFLRINGKTHKDILDDTKKDYHTALLHNIHPWTPGKLPAAYCNVKNKDNKKSRLISASHKAPFRRLLRLTSKTLTYLLENLPPSFTQFTLHSMQELKPKVESIARDLSRIYGPNTDIVTSQTDVEKMFTNLDHGEILSAITWLCNTYIGTLKSKPYITRSSYKDFIYVEKSIPYECTWQQHKNKQRWQEFHLNDIIRIVYRLGTYIHSSGDAIYKQKKGAPIGGFLSSNYANIKCAYDEHLFHCGIRVSPLATVNYRAIRQVDDLFACAAYDTNSLSSLAKAKYTLELLTSNKTYTGGLSLKLQDPIQSSKEKTIHKFAGSLISIYHRPTLDTRLSIAPLNKNWESIQTKQKFKIYPSWYTYIPIQMKKGFITATILRFISLSSTITTLLESVRQFILELKIIGYNTNFIRRTICQYTRRLRWRRNIHFPIFTSISNLHVLSERTPMFEQREKGK